MEYAENGELFDYIISKGKLTEYESNKFFHQIIDSIDYIHKMGICHRDLKPENMLLDNNNDLKLIDFGLSNLYYKNELIKTPCGSPGYASPEMLRGENYNGLLSDIWSCGIVLYVMLFGYLPFDDNTENGLYEKIIIGKFNIPNFISNLGKNLLEKILVTDPNKRINVEGIRKDSWYNLYDFFQVKGLFISCQDIPIDYSIVDLMKNYGYNSENVILNIRENRHNNITTLYYLLVKKNYKKKIYSVSDLVSNSFKKYISKNNKEPKSLKLMKLKSKSIFGENSNTDMQTPKTEKVKEITIDNLKTIETTCKTDRESSIDNLQKKILYNIDEQNEYNNIHDKKIDFHKLLMKMPNKNKQIKKEANLLKSHIKTQYDNYNKKSIPFKKKNINPTLFIKINSVSTSLSNIKKNNKIKYRNSLNNSAEKYPTNNYYNNKLRLTLNKNNNKENITDRNYSPIKKRKCVSLEKNEINDNSVSKVRAISSSYEKKKTFLKSKIVNMKNNIYKNKNEGKEKRIFSKIKKIDFYSLKEKKRNNQTFNYNIKQLTINKSSSIKKKKKKENSNEKSINPFLMMKPLNLNIKNIKGIHYKINSNRIENTKNSISILPYSNSKKRKEYNSISEPKIPEIIKTYNLKSNKKVVKRKAISLEKNVKYYEKKIQKQFQRKNNSINVNKNNSYDKKINFNNIIKENNNNEHIFNLKIEKKSPFLNYFNDNFDKGIYIEKPISYIKETLIPLFKKNTINYSFNGIYIIECIKDNNKFKIEFSKYKNKNGILINIYPIEIINSNDYIKIQDLIFSNIKINK